MSHLKVEAGELEIWARIRGLDTSIELPPCEDGTMDCANKHSEFINNFLSSEANTNVAKNPLEVVKQILGES